MTKWGCTLDATNNLMWEVKTNDGYLRDKDWTYSWYEPDTKKNPYYRGVENGGVCKGLNKCNTNAYIKKVNAEKLCGKDTWRLPTKKELENLVVCPNGLSPNYLANEISDICAETNPLLDPFNPIPSTPFINNDYFPNTKTDWYWTSDTYIPNLSADAISPPLCYPASSYDAAWNVGFYDGHTRPDHKGNAISIRLVSGGTTGGAAVPPCTTESVKPVTTTTTVKPATTTGTAAVTPAATTGTTATVTPAATTGTTATVTPAATTGTTTTTTVTTVTTGVVK